MIPLKKKLGSGKVLDFILIGEEKPPVEGRVSYNLLENSYVSGIMQAGLWARHYTFAEFH